MADADKSKRLTPIFTPLEAATIVDISLHSLNLRVKLHRAYLSQNATPSQGVPQCFTARDIEVLKFAKALRDQGLQSVAINQRLANLSFAERDTEDSSPHLDIPRPSTPDAQGVPQMPVAVMDTIMSLQRQIDDLKQRREPSYFVGIGLGFITALLFVLVIIGIAVLYAGGG